MQTRTPKDRTESAEEISATTQSQEDSSMTDVIETPVAETFTPRHTRRGWAMYRVTGGPRERVSDYFATVEALAKNGEPKVETPVAETETPRIKVAVVGPLGDGTTEIHKPGCRHLGQPRIKNYDGDPIEIEVETPRDVASFLYGPEAGSFYEEAGGDERQGSLEQYLDQMIETEIHFAPCLNRAFKVRKPAKTADQIQDPETFPIPEGTVRVQNNRPALKVEGHKLSWVVSQDGEIVPHKAAHRGTLEGWGVRCSCGWASEITTNSKVKKLRDEHIAAMATGVQPPVVASTPERKARTRKPFVSQYDGKEYRDEIAAKQAEYEAETGERPTRKAASIILDRERDAEVEGRDTPTLMVVEPTEAQA
jgi:hypothetical protein